MSKSKGDIVDPWTVLDKQGADAVRWYFYVGSAPWLPSRFSEEAVNEAQRRFMGTLWNTYAFYVLYANIDNFNPTQYSLEYEKLPVMDKWILSKLNTVVKYVDDSLATYKITEAARCMSDFVDELSNWYVRRSRERFWASGMEEDKINAYMTLYTVLTTLAKISAPFTPFMSEEIYRNLVKNIDENALESVHLCDFPVYNENFVNKDLEINMDMVLNIVVLGRAARNNANIKNRQPISKMYIKCDATLNKDYSQIINEELNIKELEFTQNVDQFSSYKFKPQLKTLGPKYGKILPKINEALQSGDGNAFMKALNTTGEIQFMVEDTSVLLKQEDVIIETLQTEGFITESDKGFTVVLDTKLTDELIEEGFVRELISKIQTMRKEAGYEVLDKIKVYHSGNQRIADIFKRNDALIKSEVLAEEIMIGNAGYSKEWNINNEVVTLATEKL